MSTTTPTAVHYSFRLKPGTDREAFLKASAKTGPFISQAPGFMFRRISEAEDGTWSDHVIWQSRADYDAIDGSFMQDPSTGDMIALIDPATFARTISSVLLQMQPA